MESWDPEGAMGDGHLLIIELFRIKNFLFYPAKLAFCLKKRVKKKATYLPFFFFMSISV